MSLSIATALWDWQEAEKMDKNLPDQQLTPQAVNIAKNASANAFGKCERNRQPAPPTGLKLLLDLLCMEVQLL